jgi:rhodanese-related sulfurtransferase
MVTWQAVLKHGRRLEKKQDIIVEVEADELLMDQQFDENLIVLDVRKENEFAEGHLPGAMNLPLSEMIDPERWQI